MSARPAPRRSALAGLSAAQPPAQPEPAAPAPVTPETRVEAPQAPPTPVETPASTPKATKPRKGTTKPLPATEAGEEPAGKSKKVGIYQDPELTARARAAYRNTAPMKGYRSFSDFAAEAFAEKIEALEAQYNGGKPWPALAPGVIPTGRPMGE